MLSCTNNRIRGTKKRTTGGGGAFSRILPDWRKLCSIFQVFHTLWAPWKERVQNHAESYFSTHFGRCGWSPSPVTFDKRESRPNLDSHSVFWTPRWRHANTGPSPWKFIFWICIILRKRAPSQIPNSGSGTKILCPRLRSLLAPCVHY